MKDLNDLIKRIDYHLGTNSHVKLDPTLLGTQLLKEVEDVLKSLSETTSNRYVYHYCGYVDGHFNKTTIDGIAHLNRKINNMDDYENLKQLIAIDLGVKSLPTITSLSFLGREDET